MCSTKILFAYLTILIIFISRVRCNEIFTEFGMQPRIVGGSLAAPGEFPYQVLVSRKIGSTKLPICSGTILSSRHVLTVAHIFLGISDITPDVFTVGVGTYIPIMTYINVARIRVPSEHDLSMPNNDIAILVLAEDLKFSPLVAPIKNIGTYIDTDDCVISGWGRKSINSTEMESNLKKLRVSIIDPTACAAAYNGSISMINELPVICTNDTETESPCIGDSGAPLVCNKTLHGIASLVFNCSTLPTLYTNISSFKDWINFELSNTYANCQDINLNNWRSESKVIGGSPASDGAAPYQASIEIRRRSDNTYIPRCGGTIISMNKIITTATCVHLTPNEEIRVIAGASNYFSPSIQRQAVKNRIIHSDFNAFRRLNDIAIVELTGKFKESPSLKAIKTGNVEPAEGASCKSSGWGVTGIECTLSQILKIANANILNNTKCREIYMDGNYTMLDKICAEFSGGEGPCLGDVGGPLVCNNELTGMTSFVGECGRYPAVYTKIANFDEWIKLNKSPVMSNSKFLVFFVFIITILI